MGIQDMKGKLQNTIAQGENTQALTDELYTIKEIADMLKTSKQHIGQLLKTYDIQTINIATSKESKKATYRIKKSEVLRLRKELGL